MKLGETITSPGLEGMSLEHPYAVCTCPVGLVGEIDLMWAWAASSPGCTGSYRLGRWGSWSCRGYSQSHVQARASLLSGHHSSIGVGSWVSLGYDSSLCLGLGHGQGLRALGLHFCAGFTFSPMCVPWLEAGSGPEGLDRDHSAKLVPPHSSTILNSEEMENNSNVNSRMFKWTVVYSHNGIN